MTNWVLFAIDALKGEIRSLSAIKSLFSPDKSSTLGDYSSLPVSDFENTDIDNSEDFESAEQNLKTVFSIANQLREEDSNLEDSEKDVSNPDKSWKYDILLPWLSMILAVLSMSSIGKSY